MLNSQSVNKLKANLNEKITTWLNSQMTSFQLELLSKATVNFINNFTQENREHKYYQKFECNFSCKRQEL